MNTAASCVAIHVQWIQAQTRRKLGRAHLPPTKLLQRLAVNKTIVKPRVTAVSIRKTILKPLQPNTYRYWGDSRPYAVLQRTLDEDYRQAEQPKQLVDEVSRFHLRCQRQHSAVICSGALLFSTRVLRPSLVTLCSHKSGRCAVELYHASHLWYPPFYTSPMASSALQH